MGPGSEQETGNQGEPATPETDEPQVPVEKIRMTLKPSAVSKSANKSVLEKLGNSDTMTTATIGLATTTEQIMLENAKAKREGNKLKKASEIKKEKKKKKKKPRKKKKKKKKKKKS